MFLTLLAAIVIVMSYGELGGGAPGHLPALGAFVLVALLSLLVAIPGLVLLRSCRPRPDDDFHRRVKLVHRYRRGVWLYRGILVGIFGFQVYGLHWPYLVDKVCHLEGWMLLEEVTYLLPFLVGLGVSWVPLFYLERALRPRRVTFWQYVEFQLRHYVLFLLAPWLVYVTALKLVDRFVPGAHRLLSQNLFLQYLLAIGLVFGIYLLWPLAIRFIWSTRRFPMGHLRRRLEQLCRRSATSFRDILLWDTPGWALVNACVTGIWGRFRYVLLTRALIQNLSEDEIEAVFAHEIGHIKLRHMSFYLLFALCFVVFLFACLVTMGWVGQWIGEAWSAWRWKQAAGLVSWLQAAWAGQVGELFFFLVMVVLYWGIGFGFISRRLESEADLFAVNATGDVHPFVSALEKIAYLNGMARTFRSWRHFSPARRIEFLLALEHNPVGKALFIRRMKLLKIGFVALALASALVLILGTVA